MAPEFLRWIQTPADVLENATAYLRLYLLSLISIVSYNMGSGILRALGNTKSPTLYQLAGGIANIIGNTLFICFLTGACRARLWPLPAPKGWPRF